MKWLKAYAKAWRSPSTSPAATDLGILIYFFGWLIIPVHIHAWWQWLLFAGLGPLMWPLRNTLLRRILAKDEAKSKAIE